MKGYSKHFFLAKSGPIDLRKKLYKPFQDYAQNGKIRPIFTQCVSGGETRLGGSTS